MTDRAASDLPSYPSVQLMIDGQTTGETNERLAIRNPANDEVIGTFPVATAADLDAALESSRRGFAVWRATPATDRAAVLMRAAALIRERADETAAILTLEQGRPLAHAKIEMLGCAETFEYYAAEALRITGQVLPARKAGTRQIVVPQPVGPVVAFSPWNLPALLAARKVAPALAAGCSCILKPSEETPAAAFSLALALRDAKLPPGVLNIVFGVPHVISEHLIPSPIVRKVTLTGSVPAGRAVAALAALGPKPCTLELGGYAPVLVLPDADIGLASKASAISKTFNAGQVCTSPTRFMVHDSIYDSFVERFVHDLSATKVGDGFDPKSRMGPVVGPRRIELMASLVEDAVSRGARILTGGERLGNRGNLWPPTLLTDVSPQAAVSTTEPFGPLATIERYDDLDACVDAANASSVGLAGYVFTRSASAATELSDRLDVGMVGVNSYALANTEAPFSGVKDSGYGYEGGTLGIASYLHQKQVNQA